MDGATRLLTGSVQGRGGAAPVARGLVIDLASEGQHLLRVVEAIERSQRVAEHSEGAGVERQDLDGPDRRAQSIFVERRTSSSPRWRRG